MSRGAGDPVVLLPETEEAMPLLLLFASPLLVLGLWIWLLRALPALFDEAAYSLFNAEVEPASQVRAAWLAVPLYLLAWAAGLLLAQLSTSTALGLFVAAILIGGTLGAVVRFAYRWRPSGLALTVGVLLVLPILGYVAGAALVRLQVVQRWHSLGAPPAASVRLVSVDLWNVTVAVADGKQYTCCTPDGSWTSATQSQAEFGLNVFRPCAHSAAGWSCPARWESWSTPRAPLPAPPDGTAQLAEFEVERRNPGGWSYGHSYGQVALAADGSVWEWRRNRGSAFLEPRSPQVSDYSQTRILRGGMWGFFNGLLLTAVAGVALRRPASS